MIERIILILELVTYFAFIPIVFRALTSIDFSKLFKRHHVGEAQLTMFILTLVFSKILGDLFITIMKLFLTLFGVIN